MNEGEWTLKGADGRLVELERVERSGRRASVVRPILTVQDLCRRMHRSRRQIYRYLKAGRLKASARILGQWLFSPDDVRLFKRESVPSFLKPFFWDARVADLSAGKHRDFILARLLEDGDRQAVRWVLQTYPRGAVFSFLKTRGSAMLSKRARNFWLHILGTSAGKPSASWRLKGRLWGGIAA